MNDEREQCAANALGRAGEVWGLTTVDLLAVETGHHFYRGWHIGWVWGTDGDSVCLDFLSEHRMTSMSARRVFPDGTERNLETPREFCRVGDTSEEQERLEREYFEHNRRAYAALRDRGLLPQLGANIGSQEISEYLRSSPELRD